MKIGLVNFTPINFDVLTPSFLPLGGSESSLCYLAIYLAKRGNQVFLFGSYKKKFIKEKVFHFPQGVIFDLGKDLDFLIIQNTGGIIYQLKKFLNKKTKVIYWIHHDINQQDILFLKEKEITKLFDWYIFVSNWQKERFLKTFPIDEKRSIVIRNAIAPFFEDLFKDKKILSQKDPFTFAYTSTPFRGLSLLVYNIFPEILKKYSWARLSVFSSLKVYQRKTVHCQEKKFNTDEYEGLYQTIKQSKQIDYYGSISQKELAEKLKKVLFLIYPSTFEETSGIAVLEALASGCLVITSNLGALKETSAGLANLVDFSFDPYLFSQKFVKEIIKSIENIKKNRKQIEEKLKNQIKFIKENYYWKKRIDQWINLLEDLNC